MGKLSSKLTQITFGVSGTPPKLSRCSINNMGDSSGVGNDSGTGLLSSGDFKSATKVWNAVWNDIADFQLLACELAFGYCYYDTREGARLCSERCQMAVMGIASNTFGFGVGAGANATKSRLRWRVGFWPTSTANTPAEPRSPTPPMPG